MRLLLFISLSLTFFAALVHAKNVDSGRVINGHDVPEGKYPFMVSIQQVKTPCDFTNELGFHFCGGSVINDNTILTAAHCADGQNPAKLSVLVGLNHLDRLASCYKVAKILVHPQWKQDFGNTPDVALLKLEKPIDFKNQTKKVRRICLPRPEDEVVGDQCIIMGWGVTQNGAVRHLQELTVKVSKTGDFNWDHNPDLHYKMVFKESGGQACFGDSGGPMVCPIKGDKGSLAQFGICSFGHDGDQGKCTGMAVYANTARYIDWVKKMAED